ncbi:MAG: nitroreductase [Thermoleophilia bacterium]|nr:nitroreductase [Thermoleophilia bacterium]
MNVSDALNSRYTCRAFKPQPLDKEIILAILESANRTPSWANTQPWEIFVTGGEVLETLRQSCLENFRKGIPGNSDIPRAEHWPPAIATRIQGLMAERSKALEIDRADEAARNAIAEQNHRFFGAPAVVFLCLDRILESWSMHDLGMMSQSIMLEAQEHGVASAIAYNMVVYPDLIRKVAGIPEDLAIVIGIALGFADDENIQNTFRSSRRSLQEAARFRGF